MEKTLSKHSKDIKKYINDSKNILIVSHINGDDDAFGSMLALYGILNSNFNGKNISMNIEGAISQNLSFLKNFEKISNESLYKILEETRIDLLIVLDGNNYSRVSINEAEEVKKYIQKENIKTLLIDHHIGSVADQFDISVCVEVSSTTEVLYHIFVEDLNLTVDPDIAESIMVGILGDTGRFMYRNKHHERTFKTASYLIEKGASIEDIVSRTSRYTKEEIMIMSELMKNTVVGDGFNYSYVTDVYLEELKRKELDIASYNNARNIYVGSYVRNVEDNNWGFVVMPDAGKEGYYKISFRAPNSAVDTTVFSKRLGGGGHKPASGGQFKAANIEEALQKVLDVIEKNIPEAKENA